MTRTGLFLDAATKERLLAEALDSPVAVLLFRIHSRARRLAASPTPAAREGGVARRLSDVALAQVLRPEPAFAAWLRSATLTLLRRPETTAADSEAADLSLGAALVLDLAPAVFTPEERAEIEAWLRTVAIPACRAGLERGRPSRREEARLLAGHALASAVVGEEAECAFAAAWVEELRAGFQPDGSFGEALQAANEAGLALALATEALGRRSRATVRAAIPPGFVRWALHARLPVGPGAAAARSVNFGDTEASFQPSGDLLLHLAIRGAAEHPEEAALARWLYDELHGVACPERRGREVSASPPCTGFLGLLLLMEAPPPASPAALGLGPFSAWENGDCFARDGWNGLTVLAARTAPAAPLRSASDPHEDLHSFVLAHRGERLLADPGQGCHRSLVRVLDLAASSHNTCTFGDPARPGHLLGPSHFGASRRLLAEGSGAVAAFASRCVGLSCPAPRSVTRVWLLAGAHVVFVIDRFVADAPVAATWNWLFDDHDGELDLRFFGPDRVVARRGGAGLKLATFAELRREGPLRAFVHEDGEADSGRAGGELIRCHELRASAGGRDVVHVLAMDEAAALLAWHSKAGESTWTADGPHRGERWELSSRGPRGDLELVEHHASLVHRITAAAEGAWTLRTDPFHP